MKTLNTRNTVKVLLLLFMTIPLLTLAVPATLAQNGSRVFLQPVASTANTLTVDLIADNVADLYGLEFKLKYDPAIVSVQDTKPEQAGIQVADGNLLPVDKGFVVANRADEAAGTIVYAMTLLNPAPPVSGSGSLATISFQVKQPGPSIIEIEDVKLVTVNLQIIPVETLPLTIGANTPQTEAASTATNSNFPWWIVAAGIILLGLVGIGVFMTLGGPSRAQAKPGSAVNTRPSAFK